MELFSGSKLSYALFSLHVYFFFFYLIANDNMRFHTE